MPDQKTGVKDEQKAKDQRGLEYRHCGCRHFRVIYTRPGGGGRIVRRREPVRRIWAEGGCLHPRIRRVLCRQQRGAASYTPTR